MDEVDGMGAGDRQGMAELIKLIKQSKIPIICICNDRQSQKVRRSEERSDELRTSYLWPQICCADCFRLAN